MFAALAAFCVVLPARGLAQGADARASIEVSARIVQSVSVRGVNNLNFGDIVAPASSVTRQIDKADPSAGMFEIVGAAGQGVQVSFVAPTALTRTGGQGSLAIALALYGSATQAGVGGATQLFPQGTLTLSNGRYFLVVAGSLTVLDIARNPAGTYTGEFELSVSHTTI